MAFEAMRRDHGFATEEIAHCQNLALRVARLNPTVDERDKGEIDAKEWALAYMERYRFRSEAATAYKRSLERWKAALRSRGDSEMFEIVSRTRVLLGTGNASVFEFGFNLSYPWGVPYIAGSALKGLVSSYLSRRGGTDWARNNGAAFKSDAQVELFGGVRSKDTRDDKSYAGSLVFHDAWLAAWPNGNTNAAQSAGCWFEADIITSHHFAYYGGNGFPDGTQNPVPIKIAALRPGLTFLVCIQGPEAYRLLAKQVLLSALAEEGIGGKTAVGYGRFSYVPSREEMDTGLRREVENVQSAADLQALFKDHKNNPALAGCFRKALERVGCSDETKAMFEALHPLAFLMNRVEAGEIGDLKTLNKRFNTLKNHIDKLVETEGLEALKNTPEGRALFGLMMSRWADAVKSAPELRVVKELAYDWEDLDLSPDDLMDKTKMSTLTWPPLGTLREYLARHPEKFDRDTREIILDELSLR